MRRRWAIVLAYLLLVTLASGWLARLEWSVFGLALRILEQFGFIGGGNSYRGQIDGVNIPTHPYWVSIAVRTLATLFVQGTVLAFVLLQLERYRRSRKARVPFAVRCGASLLVLSAVAGTYGQDIRNQLSRFALDHGDTWGCQMDWPWRLMPMGTDTRYQTADHPWLCRALLDHGPDAVRVVVGTSGGLLAFVLLGLWCWPDDGIPRCARCRYPIEGLTACPECGRAAKPDGDPADARG